MRAFMLVGATAIVLLSAIPEADARATRSGARMNLRTNAVPQGSWASPRYETPPYSVAGEGDFNPIGRQVTPDDVLRGTSASYVSLPAPENRDTAVFPEALSTVTAKPEVSVRIVNAKAWCRSGITVGTGIGFCIIN